MTSTIDLILLRRPKIDYISPPVCEVLFSSSSGPVIVLNPLTPQSFPTGLILGGVGGFFLSWNTYPGALCYSVYQSVNPDDAFGEYRIVAECLPNPPVDLSSFGPGFFRVSAITLDGETPLSLPIHSGGGGGFECPFFTGSAPVNPIVAEVGDNVILGPVPVDEGFGGGIVSYEWLKDGFPYLDTTTTTQNSLVIDNVQPGDFAAYSLQVSNEIDACDIIVSEDIILTGDFWDLTWATLDEAFGVPPGNISKTLTPNSFSVHTDINSPNLGSNCFGEYVGTQVYTGPARNVHLHLEVLNAIQTQNGGIGVYLDGTPPFYTDGTPLLQVSGSDSLNAGVYDYDFVVPICAGSTIAVFLSLGVQAAPGQIGDCTWVGTLTTT